MYIFARIPQCALMIYKQKHTILIDLSLFIMFRLEYLKRRTFVKSKTAYCMLALTFSMGNSFDGTYSGFASLWSYTKSEHRWSQNTASGRRLTFLRISWFTLTFQLTLCNKWNSRAMYLSGLYWKGGLDLPHFLSKIRLFSIDTNSDVKPIPFMHLNLRHHTLKLDNKQRDLF